MPLTFTVQRTTESLSTPIVVNFAVSGTATFGTDYTVSGHTTFTATTASLTIPANATSGSIVVTPVADAIVEADESVILTILPSPINAQLGPSTVAIGTILNDDVGAASVRILANSGVSLYLQAYLQGLYDGQAGSVAPDTVPGAVSTYVSSLNATGYKLYMGHNDWWYTNAVTGLTAASWLTFAGGAGGKSNFGANIVPAGIITFK
jgi:hypothetical protein